MHKIEDHFYISAALMPFIIVFGVLGEFLFTWLSDMGITWIDPFIGKAIPMAAMLILYWMLCLQILGWQYLKSSTPYSWRHERLLVAIIAAPFAEAVMIIFIAATSFK